jgi:hypothetical protein
MKRKGENKMEDVLINIGLFTMMLSFCQLLVGGVVALIGHLLFWIKFF